MHRDWLICGFLCGIVLPLDFTRMADEAEPMFDDTRDQSYVWAEIVLAYAGKNLRPPLQALLEFDYRLARIILSTSEPALAQIKLAWWREEIKRERKRGQTLPPDPLLAKLLLCWAAKPEGLLATIDGWEHLIGSDPDSEACAGFRQGRGDAFSALASLAGESGAGMKSALHGQAWANADLALHFGRSETEQAKLPALPKRLRALAIIGGLAKRATFRRIPMMGDRFSPLVATRLGIFGA